MTLGMTAETLERSMSEREFRAWSAYAQRHFLPLKRIEIYLAQIAFLVVKSMSSGGQNWKLDDFLLKDVETEAQRKEESPAERARKVFGFKPRKKG